MADTPEYTETQLAQHWLIRNIDAVLKHTGRSNGHPGEEPNTATNQTARGPAPIVITRVASDSRSSDGKVKKEDFINNDDVSTLVNAFTPNQNLDFLNVPEEILDQLTPRVELYKSYPFIGNEDKTFDVLFRPKYPEDKPKSSTLQARKNSKQTQVGITGLTIKRLGGNPAEVDSNIIVDLKISTMDLNNLFYRYRPPELGNPGDNVNAPALVEKNGIAWIDLIKMNPSSLSTACDRVYEESETRVKLVVGYNKIGNEMKSVIRSALTDNAIGRQQITPNLLRQWEAAGTPISETFSQLVNSGQIEPVVDGSGVQSTSGTLESDRIEQRVEEIIDTINKHEEVYYLNLKKHDLIVNTDLTVEMTIHFHAHGQVVQRMDNADILDDPMLTFAIEKQDQQVQDINAKLGAAQDVEVVDDEEPADRRAKILENKARENVRERLESEAETLQNALIADINIRNKKLYNQLRLAQSDKSRIYVIGFPMTTDGNLAHGAAAFSKARIVNFAHFAAESPDSANIMENQTALDEIKTDIEDEEEAQTSMDQEVNNLFEGGGYKVGRFIFLGDIVEAALEIIAHNNLFSRSPYTDLLAGLEADKQSLQEGTELEASVIQAAALDSMQYPTFWEEITGTGQLGEAAQKTIKRFGKFVFGDIEIPHGEDDDTTRYINIADIPIELDIFREFWFNEVVSKPGMKRYYLRNLINGLITKVLPKALMELTLSEDYTKQTRRRGARGKAILSFFTVKGDGTELNSEKSSRLIERYNRDASEIQEAQTEALTNALAAAAKGGVPRAELERIAGELVPERGSQLDAAGRLFLALEEEEVSYDTEAIYTSDSSELGVTEIIPLVDASDEQLDAAGIRDAGGGNFQTITADLITFEYVDYVGTSAVRSRISNSFNKYSGIGTYDVFLVHQKQENNIQRTGEASEDASKGIYHFRMSSAEKKCLMNVQFKRSDLRGLAEANLLSGQGENNLGILREKYDAGILLRGNVVYKVGSMLYLRPDSLQGTYISPNQDDQDRMGDSGVFKSAARAIGLGGYYTVVAISHDFGSLGKGGRWRTTLDTKWNSFSYEGSDSGCEADERGPGRAITEEQAVSLEGEIADEMKRIKTNQERKDDLNDAYSGASHGGP